jgi:hypothetical protein
MDKYKIIFGFSLLFCVTGLAAMVAIGHVEEKTSFGLPFLLGCFTTLAGSFATWAFGKSSE